MKTNTKITTWFRTTAALCGLFAMLTQVAYGQVYDPGKDEVTGDEPIQTPTPGVITNPDPIAQINAEIDAKKRLIEELRQKANNYEQQINATLGQVQTLQSQVALIDNQIALTDLDIQAKEEEITNFELEISAIQISIDQKTTAINTRKQELTDAVKQLDENSRISTLALVISNNSLSEFYSQAQAVASISDSLEQAITGLTELRDELQAKQDQLTGARDDVNVAKQQLETQRQSSLEEKAFKDRLVNSAERSYSQYQQLYQGAIDAEETANSTIAQLQHDLQSKLSGNTDELPSFAGFIWPAHGQLTAYFMDPSYYSYFRRQHYGIDIDLDQGSPVRAPAAGKVGKIIEPAVGNLSVVQIQHGGGYVTYYLHLTKVFVTPEQTISQGAIIGLSGGIPGTAGAGPSRWYSTGDHLHFEIWKEDTVSGTYKPEDPLKYLP